MKTKINIIALIFSMTTVLVFSAAAHGQTPEQKRGDPGAEQGRPHEPPAHAYVNCKDKKEGDQVQIVTPREGKISASCTASPKGLFARPERAPRRTMDADHPPREKK